MKRLMGLMLLGLFSATPAFADGTGCYVLPKVGTGQGSHGGFRPKYVEALGIAVDVQNFGGENTVIACGFVTTEQHTALASNADVIAIPTTDLSEPINITAKSGVMDRLESLKVPVNHLMSDPRVVNSYRKIVSVVARLAVFLQRFDAIQSDQGRVRFFSVGVGLDSTVGDLGAAVKQNLLDAATSLGLDTSGIRNKTTIRAALVDITNQLPTVFLANEAF